MIHIMGFNSIIFSIYETILFKLLHDFDIQTVTKCDNNKYTIRIYSDNVKHKRYIYEEFLIRNIFQFV